MTTQNKPALRNIVCRDCDEMHTQVGTLIEVARAITMAGWEYGSDRKWRCGRCKGEKS